MFVLLRAYELTSSRMSVERRIGITMERGGISILFTSVTDLVAFCIGSTSKFGSISAFCIYCGVGIFLDFVFQISFFLGFMVYDSRKQVYNKYNCNKNDFIFTCNNNNNTNTNTNNNSHKNTAKTNTGLSIELNKSQNENKKASIIVSEMNTKDGKKKNTNENDSIQMKTTDTNAMHGSELAANSAANGTNTVGLNIGTRNLSKSVSMIGDLIDDEASSFFMEKVGELILSDVRRSLFVLFLFGIYLSVAIYGLIHIQSYSDPVDLAPTDSYLRDYYSDYEV